MKASALSYDYESVLPSNSTRLRKSTELREKETKGSKYARARVMLKHGEDRVNLEGKQWFFMRQQTPHFPSGGRFARALSVEFCLQF